SRLSALDRYTEYLQGQGKRLTKPRKILVERIFGRAEDIDPESLVAELAALPIRQRVSRPSVYRALGELVDAGLLRKHAGERRMVYEHDRWLREILLAPPYPTRNIADNLADIRAQIAANQQGANELADLVARQGWPQVSAYMEHIQRAAER